MELGEILAELREDRGLTQRELAARMHISNSSISAYETGVREPSVDALREFARFFGVTADYLLGLAAVSVSHTQLDEEFVRGVKKSDVLRSLDLLTPEQRTALLIVLDDMCFHTEIRNKTIRDGAEKT